MCYDKNGVAQRDFNTSFFAGYSEFKEGNMKLENDEQKKYFKSVEKNNQSDDGICGVCGNASGICTAGIC